MKSSIPNMARLDQLHQTHEAASLDHLNKNALIMAAGQQQVVGNGVQRAGLVLLKQAVDNLCPHILANVEASAKRAL